jgi:hypothetical protein
MNDSRTETLSTNTTPSRPTPSRPQRAPSPPPPRAFDVGTFEPSRKRTRAVFDEDEDEYSLGSRDEAFDNELDRVMIEAETPRKVARIQNFETPARRKLPWDMNKDSNRAVNTMPTPETGRRGPGDLFSTHFPQPGSSKMKELEEDSYQAMTPSSSMDTPTPSRFRDAGTIGPDLARDVFKCLRENNVQLSEDTETALTNVLKKHAKMTEGLRLGREASRKEVKAKEARIAELTLRNNTLQAEQEALEAKMKVVTWETEL